MGRFIFLLVVYGIASTTKAESSNEISWAEAVSKTVSSKSHFVMLADTDHTSKNLPVLFSHLMPLFQSTKGHINCLFIEHDLRLQKAYSKFSSGQISYEESVFASLADIYKEIGRPAPTTGGSESAYKYVLSSAIENQITPVAYDVAFNSKLGIKLIEAFKNYFKDPKNPAYQKRLSLLEDQRHLQMTKNIVKFFSKFRCAAAVLITGEGHIQYSHGKGIPPFQDYLLQKGFRSDLYLTQSLKCDEPNQSQEKQIQCNKITEAGLKGVANLVPKANPNFRAKFFSP
jgi:hypothetical protein